MAQQPADRMHGVTSIEKTEGIRVIDDIATAVIGVVCTGEDADKETFPENEAVFLTSSKSALRKAGSKGTLFQTLNAISDQADCQVIVVRVPTAKDEAEQMAQIIGKIEDGKVTGLHALRNAKAKTGYEPKILGIPEFTQLEITTALAAAAEELNAFAYAGTGLDNLEESFAYRQNFGSRELMLIDNDFTGFDVTTKTNSKAYTIARILGARAKLDREIGWHKSISNTVINNVSGLRLNRSFGLTNRNSDANALNNNNISTLIREQGFRTWGNRTCSAEPMYGFEVATRTAQIVKQTIAESFMWAMDKPMHPSLLKDIALGINAKLASWVHQGRLLGGQVYIDRDNNPPENIGNGVFWFDYEITYVPPLENIGLVQHMTDKFFVNLQERAVGFNSDLKPTTI